MVVLNIMGDKTSKASKSVKCSRCIAVVTYSEQKIAGSIAVMQNPRESVSKTHSSGRVCLTQCRRSDKIMVAKPNRFPRRLSRSHCSSEA